MRDELELCYVKEVSGRRSVVDTGKSCIPTEIPSDLKFFFSYGIVAPPHPRSLYEFKNKGVARIAIRKRMKRKSENPRGLPDKGHRDPKRVKAPELRGRTGKDKRNDGRWGERRGAMKAERREISHMRSVP